MTTRLEFEFVTDIVVVVVLLLGFGALGLDAMPNDLWESLPALLVTAGPDLLCQLGQRRAHGVFPVVERAYASGHPRPLFHLRH